MFVVVVIIVVSDAVVVEYSAVAAVEVEEKEEEGGDHEEENIEAAAQKRGLKRDYKGMMCPSLSLPAWHRRQASVGSATKSGRASTTMRRQPCSPM